MQRLGRVLIYLMEKQKILFGFGKEVFYNVTSKARSKIIFEDNRIISLDNTYSPTYADYFATLLDKKKNMFAMVSLEIGKNSKIIEGTCEIY